MPTLARGQNKGHRRVAATPGLLRLSFLFLSIYLFLAVVQAASVRTLDNDEHDNNAEPENRT